jgi:hypothetical protein
VSFNSLKDFNWELRQSYECLPAVSRTFWAFPSIMIELHANFRQFSSNFQQFPISFT